MKEGWTSLHKTIRVINLVVKGLMHFYLEEEVGHVDVLYCKTFLAT